VLVPISPRWHTPTLAAANPAEPRAPVLHPSPRTPLRALGGAES